VICSYTIPANQQLISLNLIETRIYVEVQPKKNIVVKGFVARGGGAGSQATSSWNIFFFFKKKAKLEKGERK
jgi:hypothetical protein